MTSTRALIASLAASTAVVLTVITAVPAQAATTSARSLLYKVASPRRATAYDRAKFPDWIDANGDCQNTRHEVLITESKVTPTYSSRHCTVTKGKWVSRWDNRTWTNPSDVDIDHHVPLAEAWGSGARSWTSRRPRALRQRPLRPGPQRDDRQPELLQAGQRPSPVAAPATPRAAAPTRSVGSR